VVSIVAALWSASAGTGNLMAAVNAVYDEEETRGFAKRQGTPLLLTLGAICVRAACPRAGRYRTEDHRTGPRRRHPRRMARPAHPAALCW
jgi:hypothetical protein